MLKDDNGFTLTELIVAIVVAVILLTVASNAIINLNRLSARSRALAIANAAAENKTEEIRSIGYLNLDSAGDGTFSIDTSDLPDELINPVASYTVSTPETGLKQVEINLAYDVNGDTENLNYTTYISELGVGQ